MTDRLICRQRRAAPLPTIGYTLRYAIETIRLSDRQDGGNYQIVSTVEIDSSPDIPVHRKVRLFCARSGRLVRETWSDAATGAYEFRHIRRGPWVIVAHDYTGTYNAVIADPMLANLP
jgi:hypothetical protein